jgi:AcrR family transcriptional regulator
MVEQATRVGGQRPGGRSARIRAAILDATLDLLAEGSYDGLRIDEVAARAGVNKTTVYRRWPTKAELVADAIRARSQEHVRIPDTGSLEGDLRGLARAVAANIGGTVGESVTKTLVAAAATAEEVATGAASFWAERIELATAIVERAVARGELDRRADAGLVIESLIGPLYVRLLLTGEPVTRSLADRVATLTAAGARAAYPPRAAQEVR